MMTPSSKTYAWQQDVAVNPIEPPQLPADFILMTDAQPLITALDVRWVARVFDKQSGTEGLLIYEDNREVAHLTADETIGMLSYLIREASALLPVCDPTISAAHAQTMEQLRSLWWMEETRKARAVLAQGSTSQEQEAQG
ncbi:MAG: hypothetical protein H0U76_00210 [Ktedonobacteraceae bacterium]|nr:hypothetical protein [Ktedonobacteraceae bacterium]